MSTVDVLILARPKLRSACKKATRRARKPKPAMTPVDRLGLALREAIEAADALLEAHGDECGCVQCYNANGAAFNLRVHFSTLDCEAGPDDAPLLWDRGRPKPSSPF
jgi:hypothetical protein